MTKAYEFNWQVPVPEQLLKGCVFDMWEEDKEETNYEPEALFRVDDLGFFIYWKSTGNYGRVLELSHVNDIRRGGVPKFPVDDGTDESRKSNLADDVSLNHLSVERTWSTLITRMSSVLTLILAQLWQSGLRKITNNIKANNICPSTCLKKHWMKLGFMVDPNGKIPVRRIAQTFASGKTEKMVYQCLADVGLPSGKNDSIEPSDFTAEKFYQIYHKICPRNDIEELFQSITQGKVETINIQQLVTFLNDRQRDPRLNEILCPKYSDKRATEILTVYEQDEQLVKEGLMSKDGFIRYLMSDENAPSSWIAWTCTWRWTSPWPTTTSTLLTTRTSLAGSSAVNHPWRCTDRCCWRDAGVWSWIVGMAKGRRGAHHHSRESHVHGHPLQGNKKQQYKLAKYCDDILGDLLLKEPIPGFPLNEPGKLLPSPSDLKRKILIKNKRLKPEVEKQELELFLRGQLGNEEDDEEGEMTTNESGTAEEEKKEVSEEQMAMANYQYTGATTHVHPYLSNMINYAEPVKFQGFDVAEEKNIHHNMSSFAETAALGYLKSQAIEFVKYPSFNLL
ncbi:1-phosphatidylinositol 4,5-bisphosphate phosphodiesterase beta-4 [Caerostris extrusa]|uniref:phosphoinositide phospholipase C n=1 Tax=Caerostris extrusa TaxID=172846 RepID=A0AAV4TC00_CAEEX|nr:1-phosphatidylinositol 4,5-bisphosphate phosphodiesterase beta-4 [Caerostris extrusa]